jgi:tRNA pseudouridine-54 N-methylase
MNDLKSPLFSLKERGRLIDSFDSKQDASFFMSTSLKLYFVQQQDRDIVPSFLSLKDSFILGDHLMLNAEYHFGVREIC